MVEPEKREMVELYLLHSGIPFHVGKNLNLLRI